MGQYHIVCNFTKKEYIHPHTFGDGLKLLEFGCSANGTLTGLTILLAASNDRGGGDLHVDGSELAKHVVGRWAGDQIAIVGDYHEPDDVPGQDIPENFWDVLYDQRDGWVDISEHVIDVMEMDGYVEGDRHQIIAYSHGYVTTKASSFGGEHKSRLDVETGNFVPDQASEQKSDYRYFRKIYFVYNGKPRELLDAYLDGNTLLKGYEGGQFKTFSIPRIIEENNPAAQQGSLRPDMVVYK